MSERLNGFQRELDDELEKLRKYYFWIHLTADMGCGICFVIGSIFFFYQSLLYDGTWLFLIGSILFAAKPFIRLFHELHRQKRISQAHSAKNS